MNSLVSTAESRAAVSGSKWQGTPGEQDMWYFVIFEALVFTAYFSAYMFYRINDPELFLLNQAKLDQNFGVANTVLLLTSSLTIAMAVSAAKLKSYKASRALIIVTMLLGLVFIGSKVFEWSVKINEGYTLASNVFFSFYYFLTAIHVFHVFMGFIILTIVYLKLKSADDQGLKTVQTGATYWHLVDFLWVFIFALVYVMR